MASLGGRLSRVNTQYPIPPQLQTVVKYYFTAKGKDEDEDADIFGWEGNDEIHGGIGNDYLDWGSSPPGINYGWDTCEGGKGTDHCGCNVETYCEY